MQFIKENWKVIAGAFVCSLSVAAIAESVGALPGSLSSDVEKALAERLPKTEITAVDCDKISGLCEIQAKQNLFYVDGSGRYLIIGRVYDMETKQDLTAAKLLDMNPDMLVGGGAAAGQGGNAPGGQKGAGKAPPEITKVDASELAKLPESGAIEMGRGKKKNTVFSDFRCGYCKRLHETLETLNVKVVERPISVLGTRPISESVICAADRRKAVNQAYDGGSITTRGNCDTSGLDANEAFARKNGFTGTPTIVREDGAVVQGYRDREFLKAWINGSAS